LSAVFVGGERRTGRIVMYVSKKIRTPNLSVSIQAKSKSHSNMVNKDRSAQLTTWSNVTLEQAMSLKKQFFCN